MILRINGGAGSKSRSKMHRQFLQMLVDRLNLNTAFGNAVLGTDDGGYHIYFESDVDKDLLKQFLNEHGALRIEESSDALYAHYNYEAERKTKSRGERPTGGQKPTVPRTSTMIFNGQSLRPQVVRYTRTLLEQGLTVLGFIFDGDYQMPVFVGDTDPGLWQAVEDAHKDMHRHWTGTPSKAVQARIYLLHVPLSLSALDHAVELVDKGVSIVGFYAHDDDIEALTAGVLSPDDYDRLIGRTGA